MPISFGDKQAVLHTMNFNETDAKSVRLHGLHLQKKPKKTIVRKLKKPARDKARIDIVLEDM